jgi:hypothetical protein
VPRGERRAPPERGHDRKPSSSRPSATLRRIARVVVDEQDDRAAAARALTDDALAVGLDPVAAVRADGVARRAAEDAVGAAAVHVTRSFPLPPTHDVAARPGR